MMYSKGTVSCINTFVKEKGKGRSHTELISLYNHYQEQCAKKGSLEDRAILDKGGIDYYEYWKIDRPVTFEDIPETGRQGGGIGSENGETETGSGGSPVFGLLLIFGFIAAVGGGIWWFVKRKK